MINSALSTHHLTLAPLSALSLSALSVFLLSALCPMLHANTERDFFLIFIRGKVLSLRFQIDNEQNMVLEVVLKPSIRFKIKAGRWI
jgi:hypothetical protein